MRRDIAEMEARETVERLVFDRFLVGAKFGSLRVDLIEVELGKKSF